MTYQANTYALLGRPQLAARAQARAVTLARQIRHPFTLVYALILAAWAEVLYGAWQPLDERLEEARKLCTEHGFDFIGTWQRAMHGWREVIRGRQTGLAEILAAVSDHAKMGASAGETFLYSLVADAHLRCGDAGAALQAVREGLAKAKRQNETCFEPELLRLRAEASLLRGDDATATESLAEAIGIASRQGSCWFRLRAAKRLAGLYERQGRAEQGRRLLAEAWAAVSPTEQEDLARALEATAPGPQSASGPAPVSIRTSVAVLPFVSLSADPENDYFADGITEDVIAQLSKIAALRVTSRTSAMQFKKRQASLREIGQRLGVAKVLDGSVRRAGTRVRIVAQLVDAASDEHLWAETYDRELSDVFAVQSDVALNVAGSLRAVLSLNERERVQRRPTVNMDAYNEYLLGRHQLNKRSDEGLRLAIAHFERAVALDPGYASAYAGLADAYNIAGLGYSAMPPKDARARAKAAAQHALELDEALPEAHTSLGFGQMVYEWDFRAAEQSFLKAIGLNPSYAPALQWRAQALNVQERFAEGHDSVRRAAELDPLSVVIATERSWPFLYEARWDEALVQLRKALELDPGFALAHYNIGNCYENKGMYEEAIADYEKSVALSGRLPFMLAGLGRAYAIAGRMAEARECLDELLKRAQTTSGVAVSVALVYDAHKDGPRALEWLERGYAEREPFAGCLFMDKWLPFESVRHEPRFQVLLAKIGNPAAR